MGKKLRCSVLFIAIPDLRTYFIHLSLSSVSLIDSSTGSPVRVLMLSIQAVCGLPRLRCTTAQRCVYKKSVAYYTRLCI